MSKINNELWDYHSGPKDLFKVNNKCNTDTENFGHIFVHNKLYLHKTDYIILSF